MLNLNWKLWLGIIGWVLAIAGFSLATVLISKVHLRILHRPSSWGEVMNKKEKQLAAWWGDDRPLIVFLGDSHVEMGSWYDLFHGGYAVRNCGLSMSRIEDIVSLTGALPCQAAAQVVILCGINNLAAGDTVDSSLLRYQVLIQAVRRKLKTSRISIVAVFPLRDDFHSGSAVRINNAVEQFNIGLKHLCETQKCRYLNINGFMTTPSGTLNANYTDDGLHLNEQGYRVFASALETKLAE
jgi:GDSL-like Lipase/Acylhydrolase family